MTTPPGQNGWRMPAEWEPHQATWLAWPHNRDDWPGKFTPIPWVWAEIVRRLSQSERIHLLIEDEKAERKVGTILKKGGVDLAQVRFFAIPTDRVWIRDYGPIFVTRTRPPLTPKKASGGGGSLGITGWHFTAWAKYPNWQKDHAVPARIASQLKLPIWLPSVARGKRIGGRRVVLEGGSIDVNGQGLLLTTEECMLSPIQERNPGMERADLEKILGDFLGIRKALWLGRGIAGDDTHGHVDDLARFVGPRTVVAVVEDNPDDPNFTPLQDNLRRLQEMTDPEGKRLEVVPLPMPQPLFFQGQRLPASYANFYIANHCVLVPTFNDPHDRLALGILADLFPTRKVIGIHAVDLVWGLGTLHCLTQQQPEG